MGAVSCMICIESPAYGDCGAPGLVDLGCIRRANKCVQFTRSQAINIVPHVGPWKGIYKIETAQIKS